MQKITTFLWFDTEAEEAANFYVSIFKDSRILEMTHYGEDGPGPAGSVLVVKFQLAGMEYLALNGPRDSPFTNAVSLLINCENQAEVNHYWEKLMAGGGEPIACGWLKDKYGFRWQVVPTILLKYLQDKDKAKAQRVMQAMMKMVKLDIAAIEKAYKG
jgi:predicted 3-demethylubiquinone-9 3-methyltransferase (glyoxalase superfamily)